MPTPPPANTPNQQGLTPEGLTNQLFDVALSQSASKDPGEIAQQVIDFLGGSLVYALRSAKRDVVVFLTETLIYVAAASSPDEAARKVLLKQIGDTIANASASASAPTPTGAPPPAGKP